MKYKVKITQIEIIEVEAYSKEQAVQQIIDRLNTKNISKVDIVEDGDLNNEQQNNS